MRLALLSDAHGNATGLQACLDKLPDLSVDATYFLGDAVGYFSGGADVIGLLESHGARCQLGNHEAMMLGVLPLEDERDRYYRLRQQREVLDAGVLERVTQWPQVRELEADGVRILMSHGSPAPSLTERIHEDTPWTPPEDFAYDAVFIGHTHRPWCREVEGVQLINPGSCGMPRDRGDLAAFAVYDTEARTAELYRAEFDTAEALRRYGADVEERVAEIFTRRESFQGTVL